MFVLGVKYAYVCLRCAALPCLVFTLTYLGTIYYQRGRAVVAFMVIYIRLWTVVELRAMSVVCGECSGRAVSVVECPGRPGVEFRDVSR